MKNLEKDIFANNKDWIYKKYCIEKLSIRQLAFICGVSSDTIWTRLRRFNIKIRGREEANKISKKPLKYRKTNLMIAKHNSQKTGINMLCKNCNEKFYIANSRIYNRKFCSRKCFLDWNKKYRFKNNQNWREYPEYDEWRKNVYKKDGWKCVLCKSKRKINAHHIHEGKSNKNKRFKTNNGITLCEYHHIMLHKNPRSFIKELIKQISNIGEHLEADNPEASIRNILYALTTTKRKPERFMV